MADSGDSTVNLSALQRVDPYIAEIVDSASQVALYKFSAKDNEWDKTGVEGTLFIYRRSAAPLYGFIIMNRLSKTNQVEPLTKDLELQREDPYLLYRNAKLNIFGIWFYDKADCCKISEVTTSLLQKEKDRGRIQQRRLSESDSASERIVEEPSQRGVDILSMLSQAQDVYSKNRGGVVGDVTVNRTVEPKPIIESPNAGTVAGSNELIRPKAVRMSGGAPDVTLISQHHHHHSSDAQPAPLTVEALFASATKGQAVSGADIILGPSSLDRRRPAVPLAVHVPVTSVPSSAASAGVVPTATNPLLQRLMSNPENLVEHIERRQRNEAPTVVPSTVATTTADELVRELRDTLKLVSTGAANSVKPPIAVKTDVGLYDHSIPLTPDRLLSCIGGRPAATVLTPAMLESSPSSAASSGSRLAASTSAGVLKALQSTSPAQFSEGLGIPFMFATPPKASANPLLPLMSPMMFTQATPAAATLPYVSSPSLSTAPTSSVSHFPSVEPLTPPVSAHINGNWTYPSDAVGGGRARAEVASISPLTKAQLQQAFSYLIKNDPEFVGKLHEAYVLSLNQLTSSHKT